MTDDFDEDWRVVNPSGDDEQNYIDETGLLVQISLSNTIKDE